MGLDFSVREVSQLPYLKRMLAGIIKLTSELWQSLRYCKAFRLLSQQPHHSQINKVIYFRTDMGLHHKMVMLVSEAGLETTSSIDLLQFGVFVICQKK
jgi:hypothetical protein